MNVLWRKRLEYHGSTGTRHHLAFEVRHEQRVFAVAGRAKSLDHDIELEFLQFLGTFRLLNGRDNDAAPAPKK
jgi:hypothetical protein